MSNGFLSIQLLSHLNYTVCHKNVALYFCLYLLQLLNDFLNSFTGALCRQFADSNYYISHDTVNASLQYFVFFDTVLDSISISDYDVFNSIRKHKCKLSSGPDGIPPILIKKFCYLLCRPLSLLFGQFISIGFVPDLWRKAVVIPMFKKGCLLYTSPSPRDRTRYRMPSSA